MNDEPVRSKREYSTKSRRRAQGGKIKFLNRVEHVDHVEFLATKNTKDTKVFNAESQRRRGAEEIFGAGALPQTPINVESQMISSHLGYGVKPHLQNPSLCSL